MILHDLRTFQTCKGSAIVRGFRSAITLRLAPRRGALPGRSCSFFGMAIGDVHVLGERNIRGVRRPICAGIAGETLGSARPWPDRYDVDLEPAICLDAVRGAVPGGDRRGPAGNPDYVFRVDRAANLARTVARLAR